VVANPQSLIRNLNQLSDAALRQHEIIIPRATRRVGAFVPSFPLPILHAVVAARAEKALPLILAVHRQLRMTRREWTPLNAAIWKAAGSPGEKSRAAILRKLRGLPAVIRLELHRTVTTHFKVARGELWRDTQ
jgi:hypothetical protein